MQETAVLADNSVHGGQAQSRSFTRIFSREKKFKNSVQRRSIHSRAGIRHRQQSVMTWPRKGMQCAVFCIEDRVARFDRQAPALRHRVARMPGLVHEDHRVRRRLQKIAEHGIRALSVCDIPYRAGYQRPLRGLQWTQADLHRELGAVAAPAAQIQPRSHRPRRLRVRFTMTRVLAVKALRHQIFHGLPTSSARA